MRPSQGLLTEALSGQVTGQGLGSPCPRAGVEGGEGQGHLLTELGTGSSPGLTSQTPAGSWPAGLGSGWDGRDRCLRLAWGRT